MTEIEPIRRPVEREGVLFLLVKDGKFLTELRVKQGSGFYGRYRVPGGEIEDGEEPGQAAFREVFEEFAVVSAKLIYLDTFEEVNLNNQLVRLHAYLIKDYVDVPKEMEPDKSKLHWLTKYEALEKLKIASSRLVLEKAEDYLFGENC